MVEHTYGRRSDFQAAFNHADIDAKVALRHAPLTADAAGLAILSHLDGAPQSHLMREIRSEGYVMTQSSLPDWKMIGVPLWRGSTVYGSLVVMGLRPQMERNRRERPLSFREWWVCFRWSGVGAGFRRQGRGVVSSLRWRCRDAVGDGVAGGA